MTPTNVQFSNGPRKYEIPLFNTSLSSLVSWDIVIALETSVAAMRSRVFGRVDLQVMG